VDLADAVKIVASVFLCKQGGALQVRGKHRLEWSRGASGGILRDIADARSARHLGRSLVRIEYSGDDS
jgi:hypothetical protein